MSRNWPRWSALGVALAAALAAWAVPRQAARPAAPGLRGGERLDVYGDPLPPGAVARMGCSRLRHNGGVGEVGWCGGGAVLVSSGHDGVRFWDAATARPLRHLAGSPCGPLALSGDGRLLVVVDGRAVVGIETATGRERFRLKGLDGLRPEDFFLQALAVSPDGRALALTTGEEDKAVRLYELPSGKEVRQWRGHDNPVTCLAFSPDGSMLAVGDQDDSPERLEAKDVKLHTVRLWDVASGKLRRSLPGHDNGVFGVTFSPDGGTLAVRDLFREVRLWDVATGKRLRPVPASANVVAFSPDGKRLATGSGPGVELWDLAGRRKVGSFPLEKAARSLAFSPDGKTLAGADGSDGPVRLWEVASGKELGVQPGHRQGAVGALSPDGQRLLTGSLDGTLRLWDVDSGRQLALLAQLPHPVYQLAFSPDGGTVVAAEKLKAGPAAAAEAWGLAFWDVRTGKAVRRLGGFAGRPHSATFSPDGGHLAAADGSGVRVWDLGTGKAAPVFDRLEKRSLCLAFSPDGQTLAVGGFGLVHGEPRPATPVRLWDWRARKLRAELGGGRGSVSSLVFSADGTSLVSNGSVGLQVWDAAEGRLRRAIPTNGSVGRIAVSPDGRWVAGASQDSVYVWETATGQLALFLQGQLGTIWSLAFHPDGRRLVSTSADSTALVWDLLAPAGADPLPGPLGREELARLWAELDDGQHAMLAHRAACRLLRSPGEAVAYLKGQLRPEPPRDAAGVRRLVAALGGGAFADREAAQRALAALGPLAEPELRAALRGSASAEVRRRAEALLRGPGLWAARPGGVRQGRAVQLLEHIGSPEARLLLRALAKGEPLAAQTRDAAAALRRLDGGKSGPREVRPR
jgi:WD40 repeat protein